jgi:hypothetical protein
MWEDGIIQVLFFEFMCSYSNSPEYGTIKTEAEQENFTKI